MRKRLVLLTLAVVLVLSTVMLGGCTLGKAELGTEKNPIKLYFVPSVEVAVIIESGEAITEFLKAQTGYEFEVKVPTTYAAVVEEMGAAEADAMAFIPAMAYVLAHDKYDLEVELATVRYGWGFYWTEYLVQRDSDIQTLADLEGKSWAFPHTGSTSGFLVPSGYFDKAGITPGEKVEAGGHPQSVIAVYEGQADFATVYFSAPGDDWAIGDAPEPEGEFTTEEADGKLKVYKDGQRIRDARTAVLSTYPDAVEKLRIVDISDPIPNDTVSFCKDFPEEIKAKIVQGLMDYAATDEGQEVLANDEFYDITGFSPVDDSNFEPIRDMIKAAGLTEDDILK